MTLDRKMWVSTHNKTPELERGHTGHAVHAPIAAPAPIAARAPIGPNTNSKVIGCCFWQFSFSFFSCQKNPFVVWFSCLFLLDSFSILWRYLEDFFWRRTGSKHVVTWMPCLYFSSSSNKVFFSNVPFHVGEDQLRSLFSEASWIFLSKSRSRDLGVVNWRSWEEAFPVYTCLTSPFI